MVDLATEELSCLGLSCPEIDQREFTSGESELTYVNDTMRKCSQNGNGCIRITGVVQVESLHSDSEETPNAT